MPQCAVPLGLTMALWYFGYSRKNTFSWENNIFEAIFPMFFWEENLKTSLKVCKSSFPSNGTSWDKYMLNVKSRHKF